MSGPSLKQAFSHSIFGSMAESWGGGKGDGVAPRTAVSKKAHANGGGGGGGATGASGKRTKRSVRRQRQRPLADAAARAMRVRGVEMIGDVATGAVITTVDADFGTLMNGYVAYDSGYHVLNALTAALSNDKVHAPLARVSTAVFDVGLATNTAWPLSGTLNYSTAERTFDASLCASLLGATLRAARATPGRGSLKLHVPLAGAKEDKGGGKKKETGNSRLAGVLSNGSNKKSYPASLSATIDGAGDATLRLTPPRLLGGKLSFGAEADGARAASGHAHATTRAVRWAAGCVWRLGCAPVRESAFGHAQLCLNRSHAQAPSI